MPRKEANENVKGRPYGQASQEAAFVQQTGGQEVEFSPLPEDADAPAERLDLEGVGDLMDALLAPTDRPGEPMNTPFMRGPAPQSPRAPHPDMVRLASDPNIGPELREVLRLSVFSRLLSPDALEV